MHTPPKFVCNFKGFGLLDLWNIKVWNARFAERQSKEWKRVRIIRSSELDYRLLRKTRNEKAIIGRLSWTARWNVQLNMVQFGVRILDQLGNNVGQGKRFKTPKTAWNSLKQRKQPKIAWNVVCFETNTLPIRGGGGRRRVIPGNAFASACPNLPQLAPLSFLFTIWLAKEASQRERERRNKKEASLAGKNKKSETLRN